MFQRSHHRSGARPRLQLDPEPSATSKAAQGTPSKSTATPSKSSATPSKSPATPSKEAPSTPSKAAPINTSIVKYPWSPSAKSPNTAYTPSGSGRADFLAHQTPIQLRFGAPQLGGWTPPSKEKFQSFLEGLTTPNWGDGPHPLKRSSSPFWRG